jgi:predicted phosphoribosyltransferase
MMHMHFKNRADAGQRLAKALEKFKGTETVVYAIPRGGVTVAREVADYLKAPLDLAVVRKIGAPYNPEYALCVVAEDGDIVCHEDERAEVGADWFRREVASERAEAKRRRMAYLDDRPRDVAAGKVAIVVDDGIATGLTMIAALREIRHQKPSRLVMAVPFAPSDMMERLKSEADEVVVLFEDPHYAGAVGAYYDEFPQLEDEEVVRLLK